MSFSEMIDLLMDQPQLIIMLAPVWPMMIGSTLIVMMLLYAMLALISACTVLPMLCWSLERVHVIMKSFMLSFKMALCNAIWDQDMPPRPPQVISRATSWLRYHRERRRKYYYGIAYVDEMFGRSPYGQSV